MKLEKLDFVKVTDLNRGESETEEIKDFIGATGIIVGVDGEWEYPYDVVFFDMELQKKAMDDGGILWRDKDLDKIEIEI